MTGTKSRQGRWWRRSARAPRQLARRIAAIVAECAYAQRRLLVVQASTDRYEPAPGRAPDTYAEFLFRTSGPLLHEPRARSRSLGRAVR